MAAKVFKGANVFMSRNLVPPELFDALLDALKLNGAQIFPCCDPSRNGVNDYHVISSPDHEKFEDLRAKGCKLIGPQCVLSCAKEHRTLPTQEFTCCLAMDGVSILASGFEKDEKAKIATMVTAMGGVLPTKASSDVTFVIVKNVLAPKYKWALNNHKKPPVTINWLIQCWKEHRFVPQESYRVPPFLGLTICVSGIPADERKEVEKLVIQNGGKYSAELIKRCTHLICDSILHNFALQLVFVLRSINILLWPPICYTELFMHRSPERDKYKVAKRWGNIYIVTRKWFLQSVARKACLSEEVYPVQGVLTSSMSTLKTGEQYSQSKGTRSSQCISSSMVTASGTDTNFSAPDMELDLASSFQSISPTFLGPPPLSKEGNEAPDDVYKHESDVAPCVADDSLSEHDDLYLAECRIVLVGFVASELRKLVDMIRQGGGSRYMSLSEKLTHVIVGKPTETEIKEVRRVAAFGVIYVVKTLWLEECTSQRKEIPVLQSHIAYDLLLPKDPVIFSKTIATSMASMKQWKSSASYSLNDSSCETKNAKTEVLRDLKDGAKLKVQIGAGNVVIKDIKSSTVFKGKQFCFSSFFPEEQRDEIKKWISKGGGEVADQNKEVQLIVERHGASPIVTQGVGSKLITTHWIHSCLEDGSLLEVSSHILYSPLSCQIPLPGFEEYWICVSQYDMKERQLLRNLCHVLGVKRFKEKLTKNVTHLLCKFATGDKYVAACTNGIHVVTAEWIYECAMQNKIVDLKGFSPKELTSQDQKSGLCPVSQFPISQYPISQYPNHSLQMTLGDDTSQNPNQLHDSRDTYAVASTGCATIDGLYSSSGGTKAKLFGHDGVRSCPLPCDSKIVTPPNGEISLENDAIGNTMEISSVVPDVAAAIEDLLEQTSKIQDWKSQETSGCHENFLPSKSSLLGKRHANLPPELETSKYWINRLDKKDEKPTADTGTAGGYDGFSETQTDSQVVGYEEDLSGRQMIIDRVRTRSSMA